MDRPDAAACSCREYTRAQVLRGGAASAGRGLPAIEPGMPDPAGTGLSRRSFMLRSAGLALSVYGAGLLGNRAFEEGVAAAAEGAPGRVLVSVFFDGGIDSLSVLAPTGDPQYATLRPTLRLTPDQGTEFSEDPRLRWHPAATGLANLHAAGKVSVFPAIGYSQPDQSHFTSRHYWEVGELSERNRLGWLGRWLDRVGTGDNPMQGLAMDSNLAPALATERNPVAAVSLPEEYRWSARGVSAPVAEPMLRTFGALGDLPAAGTAFKAARGAAKQSEKVRRDLAPFIPASGQTIPSPVTYPTAGGRFPRRLRALAAMLAAGLPIRAVALNAVGGYDTHSDQARTLPTNLQQTVDALVAFQADLEARGLADRVLVQVWSEFGRRPRENVSGTDHGAAGCAFVIGTKAAGTMVGEFPGLATLDNRSNLRATSDFRAMYCSLVEQWLGDDAAAVIPGASGFARPTLVRA